ncbi:ABC transporter substrate-binding protein [Aneurinibacillus sp. BA2021]|nr:ABC transporter substrate-binding protein [Aneurinibacillus sp. BA2021]
MKRLLSIALIAALGTMGLAGCSSQEAKTASASGKVNEVKIGQLHPLSGALAIEGQEMRDAIKMAVDEKNEAGGIKSLGGAKVTLLDSDHEGKPEKGITETQRLIRKGALGVLGTYTSGVAMAASQEAERRKTPFLVTIATADEVTERGFAYTFRIQPNATMMSENFLKYFKQLNEQENAGLKTAVLVHEDSVFGTSIANHIRKNAGTAGLKILADMPHSAKTSDLTSDVRKIASLKPDVVIVTTYLNDGNLLFQGMKQSGVKPKAVIGVANGALSNASFIAEETGVNQYMMDVNYTINSKDERTQALKKKFKEKYNKNLGPNAAYSYESARILIEAIERAGTTDKTKIRDEIAKMQDKNHILPQDAIMFDKTGQNINAQATLNQIVDGKSLIVYPETYKETNLHLPVPGK